MRKSLLLVLPLLLASCWTKEPAPKATSVETQVAELSSRTDFQACLTSRKTLCEKFAKGDPAASAKCWDSADLVCMSEILTKVSMAGGGIETCEKSFTDEGLREKCRASLILSTAEKTGDESGCAKLTSPSFQKDCMARAFSVKSLKTGDPKICESAGSRDAVDDCLSRAALKLPSYLTGTVAKYCSAIENPDKKSRCQPK